MKLHYSQTLLDTYARKLAVSVPYEITLLSNKFVKLRFKIIVSVPYEITLLSNICVFIAVVFYVSVPYEITLLSNLK